MKDVFARLRVFIPGLITVLLLVPHGVFAQDYNEDGQNMNPDIVGGLDELYRVIRELAGNDMIQTVDRQLLVELNVDADGRPSNIKMLDAGMEEFGAKVKQALETVAYRPKQEDGRPVKGWFVIILDYRRLRGEQADTNGKDELPKLLEEDIFLVVEQQPEMIGGMDALNKVLKYPRQARMMGIEGRVIVEFVVDKEGRVRDPRSIRGLGAGLDEAAVEAVSKMKFKPGMQKGKAVAVRYTLPVVFKLGH